RVRIGKSGKIRGIVAAREVNISERAEVEDVYADVLVMEERASARNVYARRVYLERRCRILGELQYTEELKSEENVYFTMEPKKVDFLPAPPI
ncbi:MAG: hypothetical protein QXU67_02430, partial [Candidatus Bathyarchaeia archaeon]